jgi:NAD-dependent dihydropyrimidine dehydrogenase PreA subunit
MRYTYLKGVNTLQLASESCVGCGMCAVVCPHRVFYIDQGKAKIKDKDRCMECGACSVNCPTKAVTVNANVGCAAAIITGWFTGTEPVCGCSGGECC